MLKLETIPDLDALHQNQVQEGSSLEYKASPAVEATEPRKTEIAKDVLAMANADGGQIIYGMTEANHLPNGLDDGIDPQKFNGLWFEQVIQQNVRPQIEGLHILPIPRGNGNFVFVVNVPTALSRAPHQLARDGRYYRRRNFRNDVMEDYEVREAMRRVATPELYLDFFFENGLTQTVIFPQPGEQSEQFRITCHLGNRSNGLALYTLVKVFVDNELILNHQDQFHKTMTHPDDAGNQLTQLHRNLAVPHFMPIFKGATFRITDDALRFSLKSEHRGKSLVFPLWYELLSPGFSIHKKGRIRLQDNKIRLEMPGNAQKISMFVEG